MPLKERHFYQRQVVADGEHGVFDLEAGQSALIYMDSAGIATVAFSASPDGGVTWYPFYDLDTGTGAWVKLPDFSFPGADLAAIRIFPPCPGKLRVSPTGAALNCWAEGVRGVD